MPENNCSQKVLIRNLCGPMRHESWQKKVQKGISDSNELKYYLCVNAGVASSVPTGKSILFLKKIVIISTMIGPGFTEGVKSNLIF